MRGMLKLFESTRIAYSTDKFPNKFGNLLSQKFIDTKIVTNMNQTIKAAIDVYLILKLFGFS